MAMIKLKKTKKIESTLKTESNENLESDNNSSPKKEYKVFIDEEVKSNTLPLGYYIKTVFTFLIGVLIVLVFIFFTKMTIRISSDLENLMHDRNMFSELHKEFKAGKYLNVTNKKELISNLRSKGKIGILEGTEKKISVEKGKDNYYMVYKANSEYDCKSISGSGKKVRVNQDLSLVPGNIHVPFCITKKDKKGYFIAISIGQQIEG